MSATTKTLYDTDFAEWSAETAELLRQRRFNEVDWDNVIEEVEDLGGAQKRGIDSQLARLLKHVIKGRIQPERRSASWETSIVDAQQEIAIELEHSPSLRRYLHENLAKIYHRAVEGALKET